MPEQPEKIRSPWEGDLVPSAKPFVPPPETDIGSAYGDPKLDEINRQENARQETLRQDALKSKLDPDIALSMYQKYQNNKVRLDAMNEARSQFGSPFLRVEDFEKLAGVDLFDATPDDFTKHTPNVRNVEDPTWGQTLKTLPARIGLGGAAMVGGAANALTGFSNDYLMNQQRRISENLQALGGGERPAEWLQDPGQKLVQSAGDIAPILPYGIPGVVGSVLGSGADEINEHPETSKISPYLEAAGAAVTGKVLGQLGRDVTGRIVGKIVKPVPTAKIGDAVVIGEKNVLSNTLGQTAVSVGENAGFMGGLTAGHGAGQTIAGMATGNVEQVGRGLDTMSEAPGSAISGAPFGLLRLGSAPREIRAENARTLKTNMVPITQGIGADAPIALGAAREGRIAAQELGDVQALAQTGDRMAVERQQANVAKAEADKLAVIDATKQREQLAIDAKNAEIERVRSEQAAAEQEAYRVAEQNEIARQAEIRKQQENVAAADALVEQQRREVERQVADKNAADQLVAEVKAERDAKAQEELKAQERDADAAAELSLEAERTTPDRAAETKAEVERQGLQEAYLRAQILAEKESGLIRDNAQKVREARDAGEVPPPYPDTPWTRVAKDLKSRLDAKDREVGQQTKEREKSLAEVRKLADAEYAKLQEMRKVPIEKRSPELKKKILESAKLSAELQKKVETATKATDSTRSLLVEERTRLKELETTPVQEPASELARAIEVERNVKAAEQMRDVPKSLVDQNLRETQEARRRVAEEQRKLDLLMQKPASQTSPVIKKMMEKATARRDSAQKTLDALSERRKKILENADTTTHAGQMEIARRINENPVPEDHVASHQPVAEAKRATQGRGIPEVGSPEDSTVVGIKIGKKDYPGEHKGAEYNENGDYIGERVRLEGENHDRIVQETDIKREPNTALTADHPGFEFVAGDRVFDKTGKKEGTVQELLPGDLGVLSVHWDGDAAPKRAKASEIRRGAEDLPEEFTPGTIVRSKSNPNTRYRVVSQDAGGRLTVQKENGGEGHLLMKDVVKDARDKPVNEEAISKALQEAGVNFEVKDGKLRKAGTTVGGLPLQWVHDVFVTTVERRIAFEEVRKDPKARAVWEKEHGKRFPDTFEKFDKLDKTAPVGGIYDAKNAVSQISQIDATTIAHEAAHHVLTTRLNSSEVTALMREYKKETGGHPESKTDLEFQEWFADKTTESLKTANTAPIKLQGPISKAVQWIKNVLVKLGVMKPSDKLTEDHLNVFNTVARKFRTGELFERPKQDVPSDRSFFAKKTGKKEDPAFTRSEEYDPKPMERDLKYERNRRNYYTNHAETQLVEEIVNNSRLALGDKRRIKLPESYAQAEKEGLHKLSDDAFNDLILNARDNTPVMAESLRRRDELAASGDIAKMAEFLFAADHLDSDIGRTLAMLSHRTKSAKQRKNAMLQQMLELNPYEQRRYNAAAARIARDRHNVDPADRDLIRKLGKKAEGRFRKITTALRETLDIDLDDPTALRRFEDPTSFFRLKYVVNELMMKEKGFLDGFKDAEGPTAKLSEAALLAHRVTFEFWCNAVLSGGHTHALGIVGNPLSLAYHGAIVRPIEAINGTIFGSKTAKISDLPAYYSGFLRGLVPALRNGYESFRAGNDVFEAQTLGGRSNTAYEHSGDAIPTVLGGKIVRSPRGLLVGVDSLAKTLTAHMEVGVHARRLAREQNLTGESASDFIQKQMTDITSEAWAVATNRAKQQYGGSTSGESLTSAGYGHADSTDGLRDATKMFQSFKISHPIAGAPAAWLIPFLSNPAAWTRQAARMTPLQAVNIAVKYARQKSDPNFKWSNADKSKDVAELFAGTALMTLAYSMTGWTADDGLPYITGATIGQQAPGERDLLRRLGYADKSMMTPFGRVSMRSMSPVVEMMQLATAVRKGREKPSKDGWETAGNIAGSVGANAADMAVNLVSAVNTLVDAKKDDTGDIYVQYGTRLVGGFNPKIVKDIRELNTPGVADNRVDRSLAAAMDPASAPRKIDYFGRPFEAYDEERAGLFWGFMKLAGIAPVDPGDKGDIRIISEWMNRGKKYPAPPAHKSDADIPEDSPKYFNLDGQQYETYLRETGEIHKEILERATRAFDFDPVEHPERAAALERRVVKLRGNINKVVLENMLRPTPKLDRILSQLKIDAYKDLFDMPSPQADNAMKVFKQDMEKEAPKKLDTEKMFRQAF